MEAVQFWQAFMQTGAPEFYLLYKQARKMEKDYVLDNSGVGNTGYPLQ